MASTSALLELISSRPSSPSPSPPGAASLHHLPINSSHLNVTLLAQPYNDDQPTQLEWALIIAGGVLWTITYLVLLLTAHRTRTTAMPYFALALNLTWEFTFAFITPHQYPQRLIDILWFALDCVLLLQTLRLYPYSARPLRMSFWFFALGTGVVLATCFTLHYSFTITLHDLGAYSAFLINLFMSMAFVAMYYTRQPRGSGQSVLAAVSKLAGTACSSVAFYMLSSRHNALLNLLFVSCFAWDVLYVVLLVCNWVQVQSVEQEQYEEGQLIAASGWWRADGVAHAGMVVSHAVLTESSASAWDQQLSGY